MAVPVFKIYVVFSKLNLLSSTIFRKKVKCQVPAVKHGGKSIKVRSCFSCDTVDPIFKVVIGLDFYAQQ